MSYKVKASTPTNISTHNLSDIAEPTGNVYESIVVIGKRARQVSVDIKEELNNKLSEFASVVDNLEEIFENREQIEISRHYEKMPKPTQIAIEEFLGGKVMFRRREELPPADETE